MLNLDIHIAHIVVRSGHSFSKWIKKSIKGLERLDFDAKVGCRQGDVSSPISSWGTVFDILISALEDDNTHGGFRLCRPNRSQYTTSGVFFPDDLQSLRRPLRNSYGRPNWWPGMQQLPLC